VGRIPDAGQADVRRQRPRHPRQSHRRALPVDQAAPVTIDQPTLLVAAAASPEVFRQLTDAMATALPNSRTFIVEGGHLINPADPAVLRFLQELPS
jgi:pimeloyl-ACP methyl ester carboxylesterase